MTPRPTSADVTLDGRLDGPLDTPLDVSAIRADFPILARKVNNEPLVYLDSAASSQKPRQVIEAMRAYYEGHHANVHRGAHRLSVEATELYEQARRKVAAFIGAPTADSVVFTRNTTEAINLVAASWGRANLREGDEIVLSHAEHHANIVPWHFLAREKGVVLKPVGLTPDQRLDLQALEAALTPRTRLVTTFHMSNVLGAINDLPTIASLAHDAGALLHVDGAQGAPHLAVDVASLGCDFYTLSGHKMLGPTGIGALWARAELLDAMPPFLGGGEMITRVSMFDSSYAEIPKRFEAGTPSIAEAVGLGAAVDYLSGIGMDKIRAHDELLTAHALRRLDAIDGLTVYGPRGPDRGGIAAFTLAGVHAHDLATALDDMGIAIRAGHHCAQPLGKYLGAAATARASFYLYNDLDEVEALALALVDVRDHFAAHA